MQVEPQPAGRHGPLAGHARSRPFIDAARAGRLVLPWCGGCARYGHPGSGVCEGCWGPVDGWSRASGRGQLWSFAVFRRTFHPDFPAPYNVAIVELEEGPRLTCQVVGIPNKLLHVGMALVATYPDDASAGARPIRFRPARPLASARFHDRGDT